MKMIKSNPFAHWGIDNSLSPLAEGDRREIALAEGLRRLAAANGIKFREPLQIDSNGEFSLAVVGSDPQHPNACGKFGETIAALLNESGGARCGILPTKYHSAENGWCRLNHFAAQSILEKSFP